jgi:hypothetical protein
MFVVMGGSGFCDDSLSQGSSFVGILNWFDTAEADKFARAIASDLMGRLPVASGSDVKAPTSERVRNTENAIFARAQAFARDHKLNWYSKAHLGNTFRWVLVEGGYDKLFVDTWTHNVLVALSTSKQPPPAR